MNINERYKRVIKIRRQERDLKKLGYQRSRGIHWELYRGGEQDKRIVDVIISECGKEVYYKLGK